MRDRIGAKTSIAMNLPLLLKAGKSETPDYLGSHATLKFDGKDLYRMQTQAFSMEQTLKLLQEHGYRLTGPRRTIAEAVLQFEHAFSAEDIVRTVDTADPTVGRATVFRTLDLLTQIGVLDRLHRPDGCHSYVLGQGGDKHYHHLICSACGVVVPFEGCNVADMLNDLQQTTSFEISTHMLEVFGICESCQN